MRSTTRADGPALLAGAFERRAFGAHDGRSGSLLERVRLADGSSLVLKRSRPDTDLTGLLSGDLDRERRLFASGVLDALPDGVGHAVVDAWQDGTETCVLMRDVTAHLGGWTRQLSRAECRRVLAAANAVHGTFRERPVSGLCTLADRLQLLWPDRMAAALGGPNPLPEQVLRGWRRFAALAPPRLAAAVARLQADPSPLVAGLARYPSTLIHGDLWLVNLALEPDQVTLLDWNIASWAPPVLEFASFLVGNASQVHASREEIIADYRTVAGDWQDEAGIALGLLAGLLELGWNKALDAAEHPDPTKRARERAELAWWLDAAAPGLAEMDS